METDQVLNYLSKGATWIDHTSTDYRQSIRLSQLAEDKGVHALEAPLTGGMALLKEGNMTVFVGGDQSTFQNSKEMMGSYTGT